MVVSHQVTHKSTQSKLHQSKSKALSSLSSDQSTMSIWRMLHNKHGGGRKWSSQMTAIIHVYSDNRLHLISIIHICEVGFVFVLQTLLHIIRLSITPANICASDSSEEPTPSPWTLRQTEHMSWF